MIFVDISKPKSVKEVNDLLDSVAIQEKNITPMEAMEILRSTNYEGCILRLLNLIEDLNGNEQLDFKNIVLSTVYCREQPAEVYVKAHALAVKGGYEQEFESLGKNHEKEYLASYLERTMVFRPQSPEDVCGDLRSYQSMSCEFDGELRIPATCMLPNSVDLSRNDQVSLCYCDLRQVRHICFKEGAVLDMSDAKLPENMTISMCQKVNLFHSDLSMVNDLHFEMVKDINLSHTKMPNVLEVENCVNLNLDFCDLTKLKKIKLYNIGSISLNHAILPEQFDLTECQTIYLTHVNLNQKRIIFKEGAEVDLCSSVFDQGIDLSACRKVWLTGCSLKHFSELNFKDGTDVVLSQAEFVSNADLDLSRFNYTELRGFDFSIVGNVIFRKGGKIDFQESIITKDMDFLSLSEINLSECNLRALNTLQLGKKKKATLAHVKYLPETLDVSQVEDLDLSACDLSHVGVLKFKENGAVNLFGCQGINKKTVFSKLKKVCLSCCDLAEFKKIEFGKNSQVYLTKVKNLPAVLNISSVERLDLGRNELTKMKNLRFAKGSFISLYGIENMPGNLDFTPCARVELYESNLSNLGQLIFGKNTEVDLCRAKLPRIVDVSSCSKVVFGGCNVTAVRRLYLKNYEQLEQIISEQDLSKMKALIVFRKEMNPFKRYCLWRKRKQTYRNKQN
jgi:uncharacterized protein YjbI with pentapeptide repeats